jgi:hypothetical protein
MRRDNSASEILETISTQNIFNNNFSLTASLMSVSPLGRLRLSFDNKQNSYKLNKKEED